LKLKRKRKVVSWLNEIEENYGSVFLKASSKGDAKLQTLDMPIDPTQVNVIKTAQQKLVKNRKFNGLLPKGEYTFVEHKFTVNPGVNIKLEISPRQRKKGLVKPKITESESSSFEEE
jgi:hypothetical protein